MFCKKCGKEIDDGSDFCPSCGAKQSGDAPAKQGGAPAEQSAPVESGKLLYTAKKSILGYLSVGFCVLFTVLVVTIPITIIMIIVAAVQAHYYSLDVYADKISESSGVLNKSNRQYVMAPILGISFEQTVYGRMFNYGTIHIDKAGRGGDISVEYVKNPAEFKAFVEKLLTKMKFGDRNVMLTD